MNLIILTVIHGIQFATTAGYFQNRELCETAAHLMSGPNWVAECVKIAGANEWSYTPSTIIPGCWDSNGCFIPRGWGYDGLLYGRERDHAFDSTIVSESGVVHSGSHKVTNVSDVDNVKKGMVCTGTHLAESHITDIDKIAKTITLSSETSIDGVIDFTCFWPLEEPNREMNGIPR